MEKLACVQAVFFNAQERVPLKKRLHKSEIPGLPTPLFERGDLRLADEDAAIAPVSASFPFWEGGRGGLKFYVAALTEDENFSLFRK